MPPSRNDPPTGDPYPVGLDLARRRVVVVGGGSVAQRRLPQLLAAGAQVQVISPTVTAAVETLSETGDICLALRPYTAGDLVDAWYVLACSEDRDINAAVFAEATARRIFCARADEPDTGSAVCPATADYDGMTVAVLGNSHRAAALRTALVQALQAGRISAEAEPVTPGVALIGGGPGDPDLITVRGRQLLARAQLVVADRLAPAKLLAELDPTVTVVDAAKIPYGRAMPQDAINATLIEGVRAGKFVVRLKGGDPYLFGRGYEEFAACVAAGVPVTVVPGVTSAVAVPALAGVPVTHRGATHEVVVVSGHVAPGHPESLVDWPALARLRGTIVLLMAVARLAQFCQALLAGGRPAQTPVVVVQDGSLPGERVLRAELATAAQRVQAAGIRPPAVVVIGPTAGFGEVPAPGRPPAAS